MNNTEKTICAFREELCLECPDAPMEDCPVGCMKKAISNFMWRQHEENTRLTAELEQKTREIAQLAIESVNREKQLARLEAEVQHWADAEKDGRLVVLPYKVGETIYAIEQDYCDEEDCPDEYHDYISDVYIDQITYQIWETETGKNDVEIKLNDYLDIGNAFRSRAEAEAALSAEGGVGVSVFDSREIRRKLREAFPRYFVNQASEIIIYPARNSYFILAGVETELELKAKILEWLSREACKSTSGQSRKYHLNGINSFLGTDFTQEEMREIYTYLGNCCNHDKTIRFIESGYDMGALTAKEAEGVE